MVLAFCIINFVIGLGVYRFHSPYLFHFLLLWIFFFPLIINLFYTINEQDYYKVLTWTVYLSFAIAVLDFYRYGIADKWQGLLFICVIGLIGYYVLLSFVRGVSLIDSAKYMIGNVGFLISLTFVLNKNCKINSLFKFIRIIVYFELLLSLVQPYTDLLNFQAALDGDDVMTSMVNGSFIRNNIFVEIITPLVMLLVYYDYQKSHKILSYGILDVLVVVVTLYVVYDSGVRTALVAVVPILLYVFYVLLGFIFKTKRGRVFAMLFFSLCVYSVYYLVNNIAEQTGVTYTKNATDSSERQAVLLSMLNDSDFAEDQTTLGLSFVVLSTLPENPIVGSGKLFQGKGYGGFISKDEGNVTDATLAIYLCETGLIGIFLLFFIYYIVLNKIGGYNNLSCLIFIYLLLVTIVDPGLFFIGNVMVLFVSIKLFLSNSSK